MYRLAVRARGMTVLPLVAALALGAISPAGVSAAADVTAPSISMGLSASSVPQGTPVELTATTNDPSGVVSTELRIDGGDWTALTSAANGTISSQLNATALVDAAAVHVRAGGGFSCAVMVGGTVRCWGVGDHGQLGDGTWTSSPFPVQVVGITGATAIATGGSHACAIVPPGLLSCWGANGHGQLGDGTTTSRNSPVAVQGISTSLVAGVSAGGDHTCAVLRDGHVRCWGANDQGQSGSASAADQKVPIEVPGISTAIGVATGAQHACAVLVSKSIICWGFNAYGELGDGTTDGGPTPVTVSAISTATAVGVGETQSCALLSDRTVRCWGDNHYGQLGDGTTNDHASPVTVSDLSGVTTLSVGDQHACARLLDSTIRCWGSNGSGRLGDGTATERHAPTAVTGITAADSVTAGSNHTCARLVGGALRCWGDNGGGQLGYTTPANRSTIPVHVAGISTAIAIGPGDRHTCVVLADHTVRCWGSNDAGQLGDGTKNGGPVPVKVEGVSTAVAVGGGMWYSCALLSGGSVACWGDALVSPSTTARTIPGITDATQISAGRHHACAVLGDKTVRCWGRNAEGELGDGSTYDRSTPVKVYGLANAVAVSAGAYHTCALLADHTVRCWGGNNQGELGDGTATQRLLPVSVTGVTTAIAIEVGTGHSCAVLTDHTVRCWGDGTYGQLGDGQHSSKTPIAVPGIDAATSISAGEVHTCAGLSDGTVACWGDNSAGQVGDGTTTTHDHVAKTLGLAGAVDIAAGGTDPGIGHSCALLTDHTVRCWGDDRFGQVGRSMIPARGDKPPLDAVFSSLPTGTHTICVRATDVAANTSDGSACATLTVLDVTAPTVSAPTVSIVAGTALTGASVPVKVAWTAKDEAGGSGVAQNKLWRTWSPDGGATYTTNLKLLTASSLALSLDAGVTTWFRVAAVDGAGNQSGQASGPKVTPGLVQDSSADISRTGAWTIGSTTSYSGGTVRFASTAGATASYRFTGRSVGFVTTTGPTRGAVKIYVDGVLSKTVDTYSASAAYRVQVWSKTYTAAGTHTVKLVVVGTSGRPRVDLDAFTTITTDEAVTPPTTGGGGGGGGTLTPPATASLPASIPATDGGPTWFIAIGSLLFASGLVLWSIRRRGRPAAAATDRRRIGRG